MVSRGLVDDRAALAMDVSARCRERGLAPAVVQRLVSDAPSSWWAQADPPTLAGDLMLLGPGIGPEGVRIRISAAEGALWHLAIVTADRIGAFAATCATLSEFGLSIVEARAATWSAHGLALQHLRVFPVETPLSGEPDWPTIGLGLRAALTRPVLTEAGLTLLPDGCAITQLRNVAATESLSESATESVTGSVTGSVSDIWTMVVTGPDTVGLLASITRMLTALGADILSAQVTSVDAMAHDEFSLRLSDPAGLAALHALAS